MRPWTIGKQTLRRWEAALLAGVAAAALYAGWSAQGQSAFADKIIRLHVIANSDDLTDQALKLRVRDAVLAEASALLPTGATLEETEAALASHLTELASAGARVVAAEDTLIRSPPRWSRPISPPRNTMDSLCLPGITKRSASSSVTVRAGTGGA